ncbi:MAG: hypothetical protein V4805_05055 [Pseudomonadota bacterium]
MSIYKEIEQDIWTWMREFVAAPNEFYNGKFPPCPFAYRALVGETVDVPVWQSGDIRHFIREHAKSMTASPKLTTRVMAFPPRTQYAYGISEYVETLNTELIADNIFLNTGLTKTMQSRYPGSSGEPYFVVVANSLEAVLKGAESLGRTEYYKDWPEEHFKIVVERRSTMAARYAKKIGA